MALTPGKISFFGGPTDPTAGNTTASGAPISEPGIAVYNHATLGGYWLVKMPNGKMAVLKQTDIGPAPWTGRKTDFTYSALGALGYTTGNFPTDATAYTEYLGKTVPPQYANLVIGSGGAAMSSSSTPTGSTSQSVSPDIFGAHHSELLYITVWTVALAAGAYLLYTGLNQATHGAPARGARRVAGAVAAGKVAE